MTRTTSSTAPVTPDAVPDQTAGPRPPKLAAVHRIAPTCDDPPHHNAFARTPTGGCAAATLGSARAPPAPAPVGRTEPVNAKIRLITGKKRGFSSPDALIGLTLLSLGGHRPAPTPLPMTHGNSRRAK